MEINRQYLTNNKCYITGSPLNPTDIIVHSTGVNNPNLKRYIQPDDGILGKNIYNNSWNTYLPEGRSVCVHGFIGKDKKGIVRFYQTLPFNMKCWGCGSGKKGSGNNTAIQFEICEDALNDKNYFMSVYNMAVEVCIYLCNTYKIDPMTHIMDHHEAYLKGIASNHGDVHHWFPKFGKSMDTFRRDVYEGLHKKVDILEEDEDMIIRYNKLKDVPTGEFHDVMKDLVKKGIVKGYSGEDEETVLDIPLDSVRILVWNYRAGLYK